MIVNKNIFGFVLATSLTISVTFPVSAIEKKESARYDLKQDFQDEEKERTASRSNTLNVIRGTRVEISGGEIKTIESSKITVEKDSKTYIVVTDHKTRFHRKYWGNTGIAEMIIGDKVNVRGIWDDETVYRVKAYFIRDLSIQKRFGVFFGTINTKSDTGFVLDTGKRGVQTVTIKSDTHYTNRKDETITLGDLKEGDKVRLRGLWNSQNLTITEVEKIKDFSLPQFLSPSSTPTTQ